jgi:hypothetical protein
MVEVIEKGPTQIIADRQELQDELEKVVEKNRF